MIAIPVMLPQDEREWNWLLKLANEGNGFRVPLDTAQTFQRHEFPSNQSAPFAILSLNRAMAKIRSNDPFHPC